VSGYSRSLLSSNFSELMWLMEQIMWKSFDKRLAAFLLEETAIEGDRVLKMTHEKIASHMGTAREVVTRMLRYFQSENMVRLERGSIEITDEEKLQKLGGS
jgi:CRP/FNR family transcriptional regulator